MSEEAICICEKHDFYDFFPNNEKTKCPCCEVERLTAELDQVKYDRSVKHDMAAEQIDELTEELARYKQGVEVGAIVRSRGTSYAGFDYYVEIPMPKHTSGQRVRVLIMKEEG